MRPRHERAAQFAPFAALSGFEDTIAKRTEQHSPRRELSEGEIERISEVLISLSVGDVVRLIYYKTDRYVKTEGVLTAIDPIGKALTVVKTRIPFSDLFDISKR